MKDQDVIDNNLHNDRMITILGLKRQYHPKPLGLVDARLFYRTLYDLDYFRASINMKKDVQKLGLNNNEEDAALANGTELLKIAEKWVVVKLFGTDDGY